MSPRRSQHRRRTTAHNQNRSRTSALLVIGLLAPLVAAQQSGFDCKVDLENGRRKYDLTTLAGEHTITRTRETPPSRIIDEVRFDMCKDIDWRSGVADGDQCPRGTRGCLTMTNQKGENSDRVIAVIPLAITASLNPEITPLLAPTKGINLILHGAEYPSTDPRPQSLNITILCDPSPSDPVFTSYTGTDMRIEWRVPAGCEFSGDEPPPAGDGKESEGGGGGGSGESGERVGSGLGWFFLLLLLAFVTYFVLGAYYNYSTYGATGADLIPHRDFWRDVPYVLRDVVAHLCSAFRPRSRSGYIAV